MKGGGSIKSESDRIAQILELYGEDAMLEKIESGMSLTKLSAEIGLPHYQRLTNWIRRDLERAKRFKAADAASADTMAEKALEALEAIKSSGTQADVVRQREIASHYRWEAKMRNRTKYGDQQVIEVRETVQDMSDDALNREIEAKLARLKAAPPARQH